jgi:hypothetical protein
LITNPNLAPLDNEEFMESAPADIDSPEEEDDEQAGSTAGNSSSSEPSKGINKGE